MFDAVVIGGGPAGSAAAIRLAGIGMNVRLYEKKRFPRPKLCGGFLGPEALTELSDLGVLDQVRRAGAVPLRRTVIASQKGTRVESALPGEALSVSRHRMDAILLEHARRSKVDIREEEDGFQHKDIAPYTVIASGRQPAPGNRPTELSPWYASPPTVYFGLQASFDGVQDVTDQVELDLVSSGYVGLARQEDGTINVCTLTTQETVEHYGPSLDAVMAHFIRENPVLRSHLAGARRVGEWRAVGPVRLGIRSLAQGSHFYIGDAACVVDPFAGEGMAISLYSSKLLANALNQKIRPAAEVYRRLWHQAFMPALRWNAVIRMLYSVSVLRDPLLRGLQRRPEGLVWLTNLTRHRIHEGLI